METATILESGLTWIFDGYTAAPARNTLGRGICLVS